MSVTSKSRSDRLRSSAIEGFYARRGKRLLDLFLALVMLPTLALVIAVLWVLVRTDGGGSGFYGHRRVGQNGRAFRCWKIRTMRPDGDEILARHLANDPEAAAEWARDYKLTDDPRVTRIGNFLRRTSLDELPQVWNVLRGEMSFVGPRPIVSDELARYEGYQWCYLTAVPGITGLWQVSGRNDVSYEERVQLDMQYQARRSLMLDLAVILRTAGAVVNRTGK